MALFGLTCLFALPPAGFALVAALALPLLGGWEAARLAGIDHSAARCGFAAGLGLLAALIYLQARLDDSVLLSIGGLVWLFNLAWLARPGLGRSGVWPVVAAKLCILGAVLLAAWLGLSRLQALSPWLVFLLFVIIAAADTCAYFSGRYFGGTKLAPTISPGKTRAGAIGGLLGAAILAPVAAALMPISPFGAVVTAALALVLAAISIGGDLFISLLKRQRGLKDTSALFPGHGGILDRFDSMAAAIPFYTLSVIFLSRLATT